MLSLYGGIVDVSQLLSLWQRFKKVPGGATVFSRLVGRFAPYTGTIPLHVQQLDPGKAVVSMADRRGVRNHLNSLHAVALANLGELATGLAVTSQLPKGGRGIPTALRIQYKKKARGTITATGTAVVPAGSGKHDVAATAELRNEGGEIVAIVEADWRVEFS